MVISDRFFCLDESYCTLLKPLGSPIFRHVFALEDIPSSFELTVCGLGVYELYLNGERVSKGYLSPYRNNPDHFLYYDHYQLATKLRKGKNVVALALGNGILSTESPVWGGNGYSWRGAPRFALTAEIENITPFPFPMPLGPNFLIRLNRIGGAKFLLPRKSRGRLDFSPA